MTQIDDLLSLVASGPADSVVDPAADLARARAACTRRRRRRYGTGLAAVAVTAVLGVGAATVISHPDPTPDAAPPPSQPSSPAPPPAPIIPKQVVLVDQVLEAGPYTFASTPEGWSVVRNFPFGVTIAPDDGPADPDPNSFLGKLVIMFDRGPLGGGERATRDGRAMRYRGDSGHTTISTATLSDEPVGVVRIQFPDDAGWSIELMCDFLSSVRVGEGALPAHG